LARKRISFLRAQLLKKKDVMVSLMIKSTLTEDETEVKATSDDQHHGPQHDDSPTLEKFDLHVKHRGTPQYCHKMKYLTCYSIWCVESQHQDLLA
jgi:hypothetical protein